MIKLYSLALVASMSALALGCSEQSGQRTMFGAAQALSADDGGAADAADASPDSEAGTLNGTYLVAIDGPDRTYLDYRTISGTFRPELDGWPRLAQWQGQTTYSAIRYLPFLPGQVVSAADIQRLLPATQPAAQSFCVSSYGAKLAPYDSTAAFQAALDAAAAAASPAQPADVVVGPGTWTYSAVITVGQDVRLRGVGAVLASTNPAASAIHLAGDRSGALFLTIQGSATSRLTTPDSDGIWVGARTATGAPVHGALVVGNEVIGTAGAHVFGLADIGGTWAFNYSHDGFADAFQQTGTSSYGQVVANRASGPGNRGDDFYAFVGYQNDGDPVHHCAALANWGSGGNARGLAAVGAGFIDFESNQIDHVNWAGIYIAQESSFVTYGSFSIWVESNAVSYSNLVGSHDGLLAYASTPGVFAASKTFGSVPNEVRDLEIENNSFANTAAPLGGGHGIQVRATCRRGEVLNNVVTASGNPPNVSVQGLNYYTCGNTP